MLRANTTNRDSVFHCRRDREGVLRMKWVSFERGWERVRDEKGKREDRLKKWVSFERRPRNMGQRGGKGRNEKEKNKF